MTSHLPRFSLLLLLAAVPLTGSTPAFEITQRETQEIALVPGMTARQLVAELGDPNEIAPYASTASRAEHWTYRRKITAETTPPGLPAPAPAGASSIRFQVIELMLFNGVLIAGKHFIEVRNAEEP